MLDIVESDMIRDGPVSLHVHGTYFHVSYILHSDSGPVDLISEYNVFFLFNIKNMIPFTKHFLLISLDPRKHPMTHSIRCSAL
jgi:hypothetical protein